MRKERDEKKGKTDPIEEILPGRECYVVTSNEKFEAPGATVVPSIRTAIQKLSEEDKRTIFVIGGLRMWTEAFPWVETAYVTVIKGTFDCDRFFPVEWLNRAFVIVDGEEKENLYFTTYKRSRL
jgi:dihydrofolate reductase